jgi:[ribosomal protein S5]-alanine N-acetyltransferase
MRTPSIVLETERLALRAMTMADVDDLMEIFGDPEAMRYYPSTKSRAEAEGWVRWVRDSYAANGFGLWLATMKETGEFAGQCGLMLQDVDGVVEPEIGYLFLRRLWGRGLATEAASACRDHAFGALGFDRVISLPDPANLASRRVAEKVGMTLEQEVWIERWGKAACVYAIERDG